MPTFRIEPHSIEPGRAAVEVLNKDGSLLAVIYATDEPQAGGMLLRIISRHLIGAAVEEKGYPPVVNIVLGQP